MDISFSKHFRRIFSGLPATEQHKIANFISHVKKNAWENLEGRNKKSDDINPASPDYWEKIAFVNQFNLWHYHIGIKQYNLSKKYGDRTSRFVLHYMRKPEQVKIVDMSEHPPSLFRPNTSCTDAHNTPNKRAIIQNYNGENPGHQPGFFVIPVYQAI
ncbi:hypothetical protein FES05_14680 [Salmonella enterica]|nr:hypothetical protein [Salmonella enterica]